jgi:hypothetical protein
MKPIVPLAFALLLLAPLAGAAEGEEDLAWRMESRTLQVRGHDGGFTFTSSRESALAADLLSGGFDASSARLTTALLASRPETSSLRLDVAWTGLAEYRDLDGDGLYGLADETVQSIAVAGLPHQTVVTPLLAGGHTATVSYTLPENGSRPDPVIGGGGIPGSRGALRLTFVLVPVPTTVGASLVQPTEVRLGAEVRDFPFQAGDTRLAVVAEVSTDAAALEQAEQGVSASSGRNSWLASWTPRARSDGAELVAGWSSLASEAGRATAVLSLPRGDSVSQEGSVSAHSFRAEVVEALRDLPPGDWRVYALGLAGAAVALGVPSLRRLKER